MARAFSPHAVFRFVTWGAAPGWNKDAPLALPEVTATCRDISPRILETVPRGEAKRVM